MHKSLESNPRSYQRRQNGKLRERLSTRDVTQKVSEALAPVSTKELANASGSSLRAAESAKQGIHSMSLAYFFNACQHIPELREVGMQMMGCDNVPKAEVMRGLSMILNAYNREREA